eukprot:jgi/Chlat1/6453/Chrsp45S05957
MPATATIVGMYLGLGVQLYSNAVRKLPLMRHPWEHLLAIGLGGAFGSGVARWEEKLIVQTTEYLEQREALNKRRHSSIQKPL